MTLDNFTLSYIGTALWSSMDDNDEPLDERFHGPEDIAPATLADMAEDCRQFQEANAELLAPFDSARAGNDFWLTRNRHGAGYWDGDYPEAVGKALTDAAHAWGEYDLYVDGDMVHGPVFPKG